jgi:single-strand DNA-binding protein
MNVVILIGNLATDVELREFGEDKRLATFRLAVDRPTKDDDADFFRVAVWDRQAELCATYLTKGRRVAIEGRLRCRAWEDEGQKRSAVEVVASRVEFLAAPQAASGAEVVPFEAAVA